MHFTQVSHPHHANCLPVFHAYQAFKIGLQIFLSMQQNSENTENLKFLKPTNGKKIVNTLNQIKNQ